MVYLMSIQEMIWVIPRIAVLIWDWYLDCTPWHWCFWWWGVWIGFEEPEELLVLEVIEMVGAEGVGSAGMEEGMVVQGGECGRFGGPGLDNVLIKIDQDYQVCLLNKYYLIWHFSYNKCVCYCVYLSVDNSTHSFCTCIGFVILLCYILIIVGNFGERDAW